MQQAAIVASPEGAIAKQNGVSLAGNHTKVCNSCGVELPMEDFPKCSAKCRTCKKVYMKKWREEHQEQRRAYQQEYGATHKEKLKAKQQEYYQGKGAEIKRLYEQRNRKRRTKQMQRLRQANREHYLTYQRERRAKQTVLDKILYRENTARHKARVRGNHTEPVNYSAILQRDGFICHICGLPVSEAELSFDHVVPLSVGGCHTSENVRVAHLRCNIRKGASNEYGNCYR